MDSIPRLTLVTLGKADVVVLTAMVTVGLFVMDLQECYQVRQQLMLPSNRQSEIVLPVTVLRNPIIFIVRIGKYFISRSNL